MAKSTGTILLSLALSSHVMAVGRGLWLLQQAAAVAATVKKNLFVGVGGIGELPGLTAVGGGYDEMLTNNGAGAFTRTMGPLDRYGGQAGNVRSVDGVGGAAGRRWLSVLYACRRVESSHPMRCGSSSYGILSDLGSQHVPC